MTQTTPHPYRWILTLYFMQGLPFALVVFVSSILYKHFDLSNTDIAFYTSLLLLPWFLKPFLSPILEVIATKRTLVLCMEYGFALLCFLLMLSLSMPNFFMMSILLFGLIALTSAMHDITSDGLYIWRVYLIRIKSILSVCERSHINSRALFLKVD